MKYRVEFDSIGKIKVSGDKYWGASTERSNKYFNIGDFLVRPLVIHSIAIVKKAAAIVNTRNKDLDPKLSKYIIKAAEEVIKACPVVFIDSSTKNAALCLPPLSRVNAPEEHESKIPILTSAVVSSNDCFKSL